MIINIPICSHFRSTSGEKSTQKIFLKIFYYTKSVVLKFQGESLELSRSFPLLSPFKTLLARSCQESAQLLKSFFEYFFYNRKYLEAFPVQIWNIFLLKFFIETAYRFSLNQMSQNWCLKWFPIGSDQRQFLISKLLRFQIIPKPWPQIIFLTFTCKAKPIYPSQIDLLISQILDFLKNQIVRNGRRIHQEHKSWILEIFVKFYNFFLIFRDFWQDFEILHFYQKWNLET